MIADTDTLLDGTTFDEYHRESMKFFNDFRPAYRGTNFEKLVKALDMGRFQRLMNMDEVNHAHDLSYRHGLQLDDTGDELGIERDGLDDDTYRFILQSRFMARNSKGTQNDLIRIAANLLGCDQTDIYMKRDRDYNAAGELVGTPNTIDLMDVPYDKITNMFLLDRLPGELERAAIGDTRVKFVNLSVPIKQTAYIGVAVTGIAEINVEVPSTVQVGVSATVTVPTGNSVSMTHYVDI